MLRVYKNSLIQVIDLLCGCILFQELAGHLPLRRQDDAILSEDT